MFSFGLSSNEKDFLSAFIAGAITGQLASWVLVSIFPNVALYKTPMLLFLGALGMPLVETACTFSSRWFKFMEQAGKFGIVGVLNTVIDLFVVSMFVIFMPKTTSTIFVAFKTISFFIAATNSYFWNKWWTFRHNGNVSAFDFVRFLVPTVVGGVLNIGVAALVVSLFAHAGMVSITLANAGAIAGTAVAFVWNFLMYRNIVFRPAHSKSNQ